MYQDHEDTIQRGITQACELIRNNQYSLCRLLLMQGVAAYPQCDAFVGLLGMLEANEHDHRKAIERFDQAIALNPTCPSHHNNRALAKEVVGDRDGAIDDFLKAIELGPTYGPAYSNLATTYRKIGRTADALDLLDRALAFDPNLSYALFNKGNMLAEDGHVAEGLLYQRQALELDPSCAEYGFNYGCGLLLMGRWQEAWPYFEHRHLMYLEHRHKRDALLKVGPEWKGEDLQGKRVYLYCTQGEGDKMQFVRFAKLVKDRGATVILETSASLRSLFEQLPFVDEIAEPQIRYKVRTEEGKPNVTVGFQLDMATLPSFDYHVEIMSLPGLFNIGPEDIDQTPYLSAPSDFSHQETFNVGIVWGGNPEHQNDHNRSAHLRHFDGLRKLPGVQVFSFQKDKRPRYWPDYGVVDLMEGSDMEGVVDLSDKLNSFADTAALLQGMDLVVTVDTSTAHLAAAMGKRVFLALPKIPDWRWGLESETTPWYPSVKLFRQTKTKDWESVFEKIVAEVNSITSPIHR